MVVWCVAGFWKVVGVVWLARKPFLFFKLSVWCPNECQTLEGSPCDGRQVCTVEDVANTQLCFISDSVWVLIVKRVDSRARGD